MAVATCPLTAGEDVSEARFYEPEIHRLLGDLAFQQGRSQEAVAQYERGCPIARQLGLVALGERVVTSLESLGVASP